MFSILSSSFFPSGQLRSHAVCPVSLHAAHNNNEFVYNKYNAESFSALLVSRRRLAVIEGILYSNYTAQLSEGERNEFYHLSRYCAPQRQQVMAQTRMMTEWRIEPAVGSCSDCLVVWLALRLRRCCDTTIPRGCVQLSRFNRQSPIRHPLPTQRRLSHIIENSSPTLQIWLNNALTSIQ